jgi:hypothetical protein
MLRCRLVVDDGEAVNRTPTQFRTSSMAWMIVARRKAGYLLIDERAAAVRAAKFCRRAAWHKEKMS